MHYFPLNLLLFAPCIATQLIPDDRCCGSLPPGPVLHSSSGTCHPIQEAFQSRAGWWKALLVVHMWTQQETGKNQTAHSTSAVCRLFPHHICVFQPFCDGSHKFKAGSLSPLRFVPEEDATVWLCGCKYTSNPPFCDGTHKQDFIVSAPLHEQSDSWKWSQRSLWTEDRRCSCVHIFARSGLALDESSTCKPIDRDRCSLWSADHGGP